MIQNVGCFFFIIKSVRKGFIELIFEQSFFCLLKLVVQVAIEFLEMAPESFSGIRMRCP